RAAQLHGRCDDAVVRERARRRRGCVAHDQGQIKAVGLIRPDTAGHAGETVTTGQGLLCHVTWLLQARTRGFERAGEVEPRTLEDSRAGLEWKEQVVGSRT